MLADMEFIGTISKDGVEMRYSPNGDAITSFSVGVSGGKDKNGDWNPTTWVKVTCWERLAEKVNEQCIAKDKVFCKGRFKTSEWTGKDEVKRSSLELTAYTVEKIVVVEYTEN